MTVPTSFAVRIIHNGVNITEFCPFEEMQLENSAKDVSTFRFLIQNPTVKPEQYDEIQVVTTELEPNHTVFIGYIIEVREIKRGIVLDYALDCADRKYLLQKAVIPPKVYSGSDVDILNELLADSFPDLLDIYDFSNAESLNPDLSLETNDDSFLDALKRLADKTGANLAFDEPPGDAAIITFDDDSWSEQGVALDTGSPHWASVRSIWFDPGGVTSGGNPDNCFKYLGNSPSTTSPGQVAGIQVYFGGEFVITGVEFDYRVQGNSNFETFEAKTGQETPIAGTGAWHHASFTINSSSPSTSILIGLRSTATINGSITNMDIRLDNIQIITETAYEDSAGKDKLVYKKAPDPAPFDLDIELSDEYGNDYDFTRGGFDDFNAVIVTGGKTNVAVDWIYSARLENRLNLELPISAYTVSVNTGDDTTPVWDALSVGIWGEDELGVGGIEVLYDSEYQWLYFDAALPDLDKAVRVQATVQKPIRVVVSAAPTGAPVLVTTIEDEAITSEAEAIARAGAELNRRNNVKHLEFDTYFPYLRAGTLMTVVDASRNLSLQVLINRINTKWLGASGHAEFHVICGEDEEAGLDTLIADSDKRSRKKATSFGTNTNTIDMLLASDGTVLYGSDNTPLYQTG